jgi:hypothetical protein
MVLPAQASRESVFELANQAKDAFAVGDGIRLDASAAEILPPAMLQLVLSMARTARESGTYFTLVAPSAQLVDDFQTYGLFAELMTISME